MAMNQSLISLQLAYHAKMARDNRTSACAMAKQLNEIADPSCPLGVRSRNCSDKIPGRRPPGRRMCKPSQNDGNSRWLWSARPSILI